MGFLSDGRAQLQPGSFSFANCAGLPEVKTQVLFTNRRIVDSLVFAELMQEDCVWVMQQLQGLQRSIYRLDLYGERNWRIDLGELDDIWSGIYQQLASFGLTNEATEMLVHDIKRYQSIEMNQRVGDLSLDLPIQESYYLKTSDIRLIRSLIFMTAAEHSVSADRSALWNYYDIISEICDDLTDVFEDYYTFNFNRFLIERGRYGGVHVLRNYTELISAIRDQAIRKFNSNLAVEVAELNHVHRWTLDKAEEAERLLLLRLSSHPLSNPYYQNRRLKVHPPASTRTLCAPNAY